MTENEYNLKAIQLTKKLENNENLTNEEMKFICEGTKFEYLPRYSFCEDYYYMKIFLAKRAEFPSGLIELRSSDNDFFDNAVAGWAKIIEKTNHKDQELQIVCQETRFELRNLNKEHLANESSEAFIREKNQILSWSKYRYIRSKQLFILEIKADEYLLFLNGKEISFTFYSQIHI